MENVIKTATDYTNDVSEWLCVGSVCQEILFYGVNLHLSVDNVTVTYYCYKIHWYAVNILLYIYGVCWFMFDFHYLFVFNKLNIGKWQ